MMARGADHRRCAFQSGLTLVEIMVAMTIGLVLMAGIIQVFVASRASYQTNEAVSRVQENGRFAMNVLTREIRMAGYSGCRHLGDITPNVIASGVSPTAVDLSEDGYLVGVDDGDGSTFGEVPNTDAITIRGASPSSANLIGNFTPSNANIQVDDNPDNWQAGDLMLVTDCSNADIFRATSVSNGSGTNTMAHADKGNDNNRLSHTYTDDALIMSFHSDSYFVRDTGRTNEAGDPVLGLYHRDIDGNVNELIEGVEDMQIQYGLDQNANGDADKYVDWPAASGSVGNIVSIRFAVLMASNGRAAKGGPSGSFKLLDTTVNPADDGRLRKVFASTVAIRNRALLSHSFN